MIKEIIFESFIDDLIKKDELNIFYKENRKYFSPFELIKIKFEKNNLIYSKKNESGKSLLLDSLLYVLGFQNEQKNSPLILKINDTSFKISKSDFKKDNCFFTFTPIIKFEYKNKDHFLKRKINCTLENNSLIFNKTNDWYCKSELKKQWEKISFNIDEREATSFFLEAVFGNWFNLYGFRKFKYNEKSNKINNLSVNVKRLVSMAEYCSLFSIFQPILGETEDLFLPTSKNTYEANHSLFFSIFNDENKSDFFELSDKVEEYKEKIEQKEECEIRIKSLKRLLKKENLNFINEKSYDEYKKIEKIVNENFESISKEKYFYSKENTRNTAYNANGELDEEYLLNEGVVFDLNFILKKKVLNSKLKDMHKILKKNFNKTEKNTLLQNLAFTLFADEAKAQISDLNNQINKIDKNLEEDKDFLIDKYKVIKEFGEKIDSIVRGEMKYGGENGAGKRKSELNLLNKLFYEFPNLKLPFIIIDSIDTYINDLETRDDYLNLLFKNIKKVNQFFLTSSGENENENEMKRENLYLKDHFENINQNLNIIYIENKFLINRKISINKPKNIEYFERSFKKSF